MSIKMTHHHDGWPRSYTQLSQCPFLCKLTFRSKGHRCNVKMLSLTKIPALLYLMVVPGKIWWLHRVSWQLIAPSKKRITPFPNTYLEAESLQEIKEISPHLFSRSVLSPTWYSSYQTKQDNWFDTWCIGQAMTAFIDSTKVVSSCRINTDTGCTKAIHWRNTTIKPDDKIVDNCVTHRNHSCA